MFCILGGIFAIRWLSSAVAGRGVVNPARARGYIKMSLKTLVFSGIACPAEWVLASVAS